MVWLRPAPARRPLPALDKWRPRAGQLRSNTTSRWRPHVHQRYSRCAVVPTLAVLLLAGAGKAFTEEREHFQLKIGPTYDQGDFGTGVTTHTLYVPVTFRYLGDWWDVSITSGFVYLDAPANIVLVDGAPTQTNPGTGTREQNTGLGDTLLKARFFVVDDPGPNGWWPALTPFLKFKIPTADEDKNLGTGQPDGGFGVEFDKTFGNFIVYGDASFTVMGDPPGQNLRNRPGASIGAGYRIDQTWTVSGLLDWRRALVKGNDDHLGLYGIVTMKLSRTLSVSPYVLVGLTDGSPDFGVGFEVSYRFGSW